MRARQCSLVTGLGMRGSKRRHSAILSLSGRSTRRPSVPTREGSAAASSSNAREAVIFAAPRKAAAWVTLAPSRSL